MLDVRRPEPLRSPLLESDGISHGYFTRTGGVSKGIFRGLNVGLGSQDARENVLENRRIVTEAMGVTPDRLYTVQQCHSADVVVAERPMEGPATKADALVTATPGIVLGVLTADCGPVLFSDKTAGVIGAAHAGWKGALTGILENTIQSMVDLGAKRERIIAVLGPSISQENYEVGPEFIQRFKVANQANDAYFRASPKDGHAMFDLNRYTVDRLAQAGVAAEMLGRCTYAEEDLFYSYRRTIHRQEQDYGRQISAITLERT